MSEIFQRTEKQVNAPLALPTDSTSFDSKTIEWQDCGEQGFWIKPLFEDVATNQRTWLMKVDAGASCESHDHQELEQIYVIEGSFYDEEKTYYPGDYIVRAPGAMHTAGSEDGCVLILFYSRA